MSGLTGEDVPKSVSELNPAEKAVPKVKDSAGRTVHAKKANQPYLQHAKWREEQERLHQEWLEKKKEHDAKVARGEKVPPLEPDPTAETVISAGQFIRGLIGVIILLALLGKFVVGSYTWDYRTRWLQLKTYFPSDQRLFTERGLREYDGSIPGKPLFLAIDGEVYDVSPNPRVYGPGGSYALATGVDAARAYGTGCFGSHRTHDLRGLSESELRSVEHWKKFFANSDKYKKVGRVSHKPIDPSSPLPGPCLSPEEAEKKLAEEKAERDKERQQTHQEL